MNDMPPENANILTDIKRTAGERISRNFPIGDAYVQVCFADVSLGQLWNGQRPTTLSAPRHLSSRQCRKLP